MEEKKKLLLIINPVAGRAEVRHNLVPILEIFESAGYIVTVFVTGKSGDATDIIIRMGKDYDLINETATQYQNDADYLRGFARKSNQSSREVAKSVETMNNALGEIAKATQEGAVGNTTIAEKVADVASKANEILSKVNMSFFNKSRHESV